MGARCARPKLFTHWILCHEKFWRENSIYDMKCGTPTLGTKSWLVTKPVKLSYEQTSDVSAGVLCYFIDFQIVKIQNVDIELSTSAISLS
jgi:hypothetical protein